MFSLIISGFMSVRVIIKQYPENAYIKKVVESIREELKIMNNTEKKDD